MSRELIGNNISIIMSCFYLKLPVVKEIQTGECKVGWTDK